MKTLLCVIVVSLVMSGLFSGMASAQTEILEIRKTIVNLVDTTAQDIVQDAQGTFEKINKGEHPYQDKDDPTLYVYVFDAELTVAAMFNADIVGKNYKGKPDANGKLYAEEILTGAFSLLTGWVDYHFAKPGESGVHPKTTYYKLVDGSDGKPYIVCSGFYTD